jgi:hypothetical protein
LEFIDFGTSQELPKLIVIRNYHSFFGFFAANQFQFENTSITLTFTCWELGSRTAGRIVMLEVQNVMAFPVEECMACAQLESVTSMELECAVVAVADVVEHTFVEAAIVP